MRRVEPKLNRHPERIIAATLLAPCQFGSTSCTDLFGKRTKLIEESKRAGAEQIDFGRTDLDNEGLIEFKDRLGTTRRPLTYFRYPGSEARDGVVASCLPAARHVFSVLPDTLSSRMGGLLYRHIG